MEKIDAIAYARTTHFSNEDFEAGLEKLGFKIVEVDKMKAHPIELIANFEGLDENQTKMLSEGINSWIACMKRDNIEQQMQAKATEAQAACEKYDEDLVKKIQDKYNKIMSGLNTTQSNPFIDMEIVGIETRLQCLDRALKVNPTCSATKDVVETAQAFYDFVCDIEPEEVK